MLSVSVNRHTIGPTEKFALSFCPVALELSYFMRDGVKQSGKVAHILTLAITTNLLAVQIQLPT